MTKNSKGFKASGELPKAGKVPGGTKASKGDLPKATKTPAKISKGKSCGK